MLGLWPLLRIKIFMVVADAVEWIALNRGKRFMIHYMMTVVLVAVVVVVVAVVAVVFKQFAALQGQQKWQPITPSVLSSEDEAGLVFTR